MLTCNNAQTNSKEKIMSEEQTEGTEPVALTGIAAQINKQIVVLNKAQGLAVALESGLDSKSSIRETSVELREWLIDASRKLHGVYADVLPVREDLLADVHEIVKANKKKALVEKIAKQQAELDAM